MLLHLIDFVIVMTVLEGAALALYYKHSGKGLAPTEFLPALGAGLALMLALRAGVSDAGWVWVAACLSLAGLAHLSDVRRRWR
jgi:hypothetical protein